MSMRQQKTENAVASQSLQNTSSATLSTVKNIDQRLCQIEKSFTQSLSSIENADHIPAWLQRTIRDIIAQQLNNTVRSPGTIALYQ